MRSLLNTAHGLTKAAPAWGESLLSHGVLINLSSSSIDLHRGETDFSLCTVTTTHYANEDREANEEMVGGTDACMCICVCVCLCVSSTEN